MKRCGYQITSSIASKIPKDAVTISNGAFDETPGKIIGLDNYAQCK